MQKELLNFKNMSHVPADTAGVITGLTERFFNKTDEVPEISYVPRQAVICKALGMALSYLTIFYITVYLTKFL
jgi:hypothetical protein